MDKYHDRRRLIGPSAAWMAVAMAVERVGNMVRGRPCRKNEDQDARGDARPSPYRACVLVATCMFSNVDSGLW